jgi:tyrosyl-tRNA synthetase
MGIDLIRKVCQDEVWGLTTPLVLKADGTKFGKTETGTVWLDPDRTSPYAMYQFLFNSPDDVVGSYLRYFTFLSHEEIEALDAETADHPERRAAQRALARSVVGLVHGDDEVKKAEAAADALFTDEIAELTEEMLLAATEDAPTTERPRAELADGLSLVEALSDAELVASRSEARRTIEGGGVYVNNQRQTDLERQLGTPDLLHDRYILLRKGKREVHVLRFK